MFLQQKQSFSLCIIYLQVPWKHLHLLPASSGQGWTNWYVRSSISFSGLSSSFYPSLPWVTLDPHINKQQKKNPSRKLLLYISSQIPLANGSIPLQHHATLQLPPDPGYCPRIRSCPWRSKLGKAGPHDVLWEGKVVECPLWCFERKLYRNNVPSSMAIENPSQKEFVTRGKAA